MEIWEQSDERRIAAARARWIAEFQRRQRVEHGLWRPHIDTPCAACGEGCRCGNDARCAAAA